MSVVDVALRRLPHGAGLPLPAYATPDSAGLDLLAAVESGVGGAPPARARPPPPPPGRGSFWGGGSSGGARPPRAPPA